MFSTACTQCSSGYLRRGFTLLGIDSRRSSMIALLFLRIIVADDDQGVKVKLLSKVSVSKFDRVRRELG